MPWYARSPAHIRLGNDRVLTPAPTSACRNDKGAWQARDMFATEFAPPTPKLRQTSKLIRATTANGLTTIEFSRPLEASCDVGSPKNASERSWPVTRGRPQYVIWASGPTRSFEYHGDSRGSAEVMLWPMPTCKPTTKDVSNCSLFKQSTPGEQLLSADEKLAGDTVASAFLKGYKVGLVPGVLCMPGGAQSSLDALSS